MKTRHTVIMSIAVLLVFSISIATAGHRTNVRGVGMAGTFVASSYGLDAVGINPANLALKDASVTLSIAPVGVHAGSDFLNYGLYNKYFTGVETASGRVATYLDDAAKQDILNSFNNGVGRISADVSARLLGIAIQFPSIGGFAFTITDHIAGAAYIPKEYVQFALYGNTPNSNYDFSETSAQASWTRQYALSFGGSIPGPSFLDWMAIGASVKLVQGFGYYEFGKFNTSLHTAENGVLTGRVSYVSKFAGKDPNNPNGFSIGVFGMPVAGQGTGFDLGVSGGTESGLTFAISLTDIGKVNWEQNIEERYADTTLVVEDPRDVENGSAIRGALNGKTRSGELFSTSLPTMFRAGVAARIDKFVEWIPGEFTLAADFNQGLADGPGISRRGRFSTGAEWKPFSFIPIRSGVSFGGIDGMNYAFGFGLHFGFFELDLATENMELLWSPDNFSHGSIAVGTKFKF